MSASNFALQWGEMLWELEILYHLESGTGGRIQVFAWFSKVKSSVTSVEGDKQNR